MDLLEAQEAILALFGASGEKAERGALLLGSVLLAHRPNLPRLVVDQVTDG
jgi:hypothetical protein